MISTIADFRARSLAFVYQQFKGTNHEDIAAGIGVQFQALEDALAALLNLLAVDPVTSDSSSPLYGVGRGQQLDRIGRIVGQPRGAADDATYRLYLRAKIRANKSSGGPEQIMAVMRAMFGGGSPLFEHGGLASFTLTLGGLVVSASGAAAARVMLRAAKLAGVRALLVWQQVSDALAFTLARAAHLTSAATAGDTVLVASTAGFPSSGTLQVEVGTAVEETATYTATTATSFVLTAPLSNDHDEGAALSLYDSPGLGLGDEAAPTIGGALSGAAQA